MCCGRSRNSAPRAARAMPPPGRRSPRPRQTGPRVGALHLQHRGPRTAADPGPAPDPEKGAVGGQGFHRLDAGGRRSGRAPMSWPSSSRAASSPIKQEPRLVGQGPALQPRPAQLRRSALRLFRRWRRGVRGVQGRRRSPATARPTRRNGPTNYDFPGRAVGRCREVGNPASAALGHRGLRVQHPQADLCRLARARGADPGLQLRTHQPDPERRRAAAHPVLFLELRPGHDAGHSPPRARCWRCWNPFADQLLPGAIDGYALPVSDGIRGQPQRHPRRDGAAGRGGLDGAGRRAEERGGRALCLRNPAGARRRRDAVDRQHLCRGAEAAGHRGHA